MVAPSNRETTATSAPHSLPARSAMMSKTGWTSVGELEIARRISLVAVCCSSASVRSRLRAPSSVKRRTFSIAMTAWSAKVSYQLDLAVRERLDLRPKENDDTDRDSLPQQGHGNQRAVSVQALELASDRIFVLALGREVVDVDAAALDRRASRHRFPASAESRRASMLPERLAQNVRERADRSRAAQHAVVDAHDQDVGRSADTGRRRGRPRRGPAGYPSASRRSRAGSRWSLPVARATPRDPGCGLPLPRTGARSRSRSRPAGQRSARARPDPARTVPARAATGRSRRTRRLRASSGTASTARQPISRARFRGHPGIRCRAAERCRRGGSFRRSSTARPVIDVRFEGEWEATGIAASPRRRNDPPRIRSTSPSTSITRAKGALHRRAALRGDRIEHGLHVAGRGGHQPQDLVGRRLLLQRGREARLELADPGGAGRRRLPGDRTLGCGIRPWRLLRPDPSAPPWRRAGVVDGAAIADRLGEVAAAGKRPPEIQSVLTIATSTSIGLRTRIRSAGAMPTR